MSYLALSALFKYLCYGSTAINCWFFQCVGGGGGRLKTSESDVCRRQILTSKDDPRSDKVNRLDVLCQVIIAYEALV